ncbi:MAG: MoaD/ThiS family protein [Candidatus Latescibacterota bacterium]|nr:MAG: MoaD/ThiS family protein [Candidatus Latescibacterota bacterium]
MPRVVFTPNLERHVAAPSVDVPGRTVREVLEAVFASNTRLRGYVLDDQGFLRQHVVVFLNGEIVEDRRHLSDAVGESDELFVMQALSGG